MKIDVDEVIECCKKQNPLDFQFFTQDLGKAGTVFQLTPFICRGKQKKSNIKTEFINLAGKN